MDLDFVSVHKHAKKKNLANIQPSWPHTWSTTHTHWWWNWKPVFGYMSFSQKHVLASENISPSLPSSWLPSRLLLFNLVLSIHLSFEIREILHLIAFKSLPLRSGRHLHFLLFNPGWNFGYVIYFSTRLPIWFHENLFQKPSWNFSPTEIHHIIRPLVYKSFCNNLCSCD